MGLVTKLRHVTSSHGQWGMESYQVLGKIILATRRVGLHRAPNGLRRYRIPEATVQCCVGGGDSSGKRCSLGKDRNELP